jgi:hypothetical protein
MAVVWGARTYGRSILFAFGINWVLMVWAIMFASNVVPLRLPAQYYATRPFEKAGRVYDLLGVRWYRRALRRVLWSVNPALLRSQSAARETMIEHTKDAEAGHLFILLAVTGITGWALASAGGTRRAGCCFQSSTQRISVLSMRQLRARLNAGSHRLPQSRRTWESNGNCLDEGERNTGPAELPVALAAFSTTRVGAPMPSVRSRMCPRHGWAGCPRHDLVTRSFLNRLEISDEGFDACLDRVFQKALRRLNASPRPHLHRAVGLHGAAIIYCVHSPSTTLCILAPLKCRRCVWIAPDPPGGGVNSSTRPDRYPGP